MKKTKEIKAAGFCIVRPDILKKNERIPVGNLSFDEDFPLAYRWKTEDEFEVRLHGRWLEAQSIDFQFLDTEKEILTHTFKNHGYSEAMEEIKNDWPVKELKELVRICGYKSTYTKDILVDMVQDLARIYAWKMTMTKSNPFLVK